MANPHTSRDLEPPDARYALTHRVREGGLGRTLVQNYRGNQSKYAIIGNECV